MVLFLDIPNNKSKHIVNDFYHAIGGGRFRGKQDTPINQQTTKPPTVE